MERRPGLRAVLFGAVVLLASPMASAEVAFGNETLMLRLGAYISDFDTNIRLSGPRGGDDVNLEDTLGLDANQSVFRGALIWRVASRHRLEVDYVDFQRDARGEAEDSFVVETDDGTYEFAAGASVKTNFDWRLIPVTYAYSFYKTDSIELAGSLGVHWFEAEIGFDGQATVTTPDGETQPVASAATAESATGPLPVFGLMADWAVTEKWRIGGRIGWFGLDYDKYSGELLDLGVRAEYWFTDHFAAGLGYSYYNIDITVEQGRFDLGADYTYDGLQAFIATRF